jgi:hypothetical protein
MGVNSTLGMESLARDAAARLQSQPVFRMTFPNPCVTGRMWLGRDGCERGRVVGCCGSDLQQRRSNLRAVLELLLGHNIQLQVLIIRRHALLLVLWSICAYFQLRLRQHDTAYRGLGR